MKPTYITLFKDSIINYSYTGEQDMCYDKNRDIIVTVKRNTPTKRKPYISFFYDHEIALLRYLGEMKL